MFQPENAIPSISWYEDKKDTQLSDFIPFLKALSTVDDVRPFLMAAVKDNVLDIDRGLQLIKSYREQQLKQLTMKKVPSRATSTKLDDFSEQDNIC